MRTRLLLPAVLLLAAPLAFGQMAQPATSAMPYHDMDNQAMEAPAMGHDGEMDRDMGMDGENRWDGRDEMGRGHHGGFGEHGMWWKNPELAARIGLTPDQLKRMDDLSMQSEIMIIDLRASLEKERLMLEPLMATNPVDQSRATAAIDKLAETRASIEKTRAKAELNIRAVLTPDQWTKLTSPEAMHRPAGGRMGPHHSMPGKPQNPAASNPPA